MRILLAVVLLTASSFAYATSQIPDVLIVDGTEHELHSQPFSDLLKSSPSLEASLSKYPRGSCSASWFGFRATWEVTDGKLYLTKLISNPCSDNRQSVPLELVPGFSKGRVLATWYTGRLVVPQGELVEYVHMGFDSKYERYLIISVENGAIASRVEQSEHPGRNP